MTILLTNEQIEHLASGGAVEIKFPGGLFFAFPGEVVEIRGTDCDEEIIRAPKQQQPREMETV